MSDENLSNEEITKLRQLLGKERERGRWHRIRDWAELLSFLSIIAGVVVALFEYESHKTQERQQLMERDQDTALSVYREVDEVYRDYVKLAIDHPELDGYSVSYTDFLKSLRPNFVAAIDQSKSLSGGDTKLAVPERTIEEQNSLSRNAQMQQKLLYTFLSDVFEVAYVAYHDTNALTRPNMKRIYDDQWAGWETYIKKFLARDAYLKTWDEISDEYDLGLSNRMSQLIIETRKERESRLQPVSEQTK